VSRGGGLENASLHQSVGIAARLAALHKPLVAAFVTHAHPDQFNGLPYVVEDAVPVYASAAVADTIERIAEPKRAQWPPVFGDECPDRYRVPDRRVGDGEIIEVPGLRVEVRGLGVGEAARAGTRVAFVGDLAFEGTTRMCRTGTRPLGWRRSTAHGGIERRAAYPGHGAPGDTV